MNKRWHEFLVNFKREKLLNISNIIVMTVTFLTFGIFISIVFISQSAVKFLENQAQVTIFFKDDFSQERILELKNKILSDKRILDVKYISKADAFAIFTDLNKDEPLLLESISANILPASLEIRTKKLSDLSKFASEFEKVDGVEEVKFFKDVVERFRYWSNIIYAVGLSLVAALFILSYSVVLTTLRTIINSRGSEIEILKLVGASDSYVKAPLIFQGMFLGFVSALMSSFLISIVFFVKVPSSSLLGNGNFFVTLLPNLNVSPLLFLVLLVFVILASGVFLGYFGSLAAIKRYLKY